MLPVKSLIPPLKGAAHTPDRPFGDAFDATKITIPVLKELWAYWYSQKISLGMLPGRVDITPRTIKPLLPHIALADVDQNGRDFQFRLFGTQIADSAGIDLTGRRWREFPGHEPMTERSRRLVRHREPYFATGLKAFWSPRDYKNYSVLGLPLARDGMHVDMVLYGVVFDIP